MAKDLKNNKLFPIIGGVLVIGIIAISLVLLFGGNKTNKENNNPDNKPDNKEIISDTIKEEDMIKAYGMSIKDAEDIVKRDVLSDNFTFSTEISKDYMYIVTVKDTLSSDTFKYEVNPVTKTAVALS